MAMDLLVRPIVIPAIAGGLCFLLGKRARRVVIALAIVAAVVTFIASVSLWGKVGHEASLPWALKLGDFEIAAQLKLTHFGSFLSLFIGLFGLIMVLYSVEFMGKFEDKGKYYAYVLWTVSGSLGAVLANNLIFFLVMWEIVTVMLFLLVNMGREKAPYGAAKSFTVLGFADSAMLLGIILLWSETKSLSMDAAAFPVAVGTWLTYSAYLLFFIGAIAKAGAMPFHSWIPAAAEGAPTPVMAFLPASLDKLLGIYLLALISLKFFIPDENIRLVLMVVGAVTILAAVMMAMVQHELKKLLSFHAVSQVGYMVLGIGTGSLVGIVGGLFHMLNHAIYKCCLFLGAGAVEHRARTTELDELGGLARFMPVTFVCFLIAALSISGVPPFNGYVSKWMVYQGIIDAGSPLWPLFITAAILGSALTLASFVKATHSVFLGHMHEKFSRHPVREVLPFMTLPMVVLAFLCVLFGVFAQLPLKYFLAPAVAETGAGALEVAGAPGILAFAKGVWSPTAATLLILAGLGLGLIIYLVGHSMKVREANLFVGGEVFRSEEIRLPGTHFYDTIRELPLFKVMYKDGEKGVYDLYGLGGRYTAPLIRFLRRLHSGILPIYVAWCLIGLTLILILLILY